MENTLQKDMQQQDITQQAPVALAWTPGSPQQLHQIGSHQLYTDDYAALQQLAEFKKQTPEQVFERMLARVSHTEYPFIANHHIQHLFINGWLAGDEFMQSLLAKLPFLTTLSCAKNNLTRLDISHLHDLV